MPLRRIMTVILLVVNRTVAFVRFFVNPVRNHYIDIYEIVIPQILVSHALRILIITSRIDSSIFHSAIKNQINNNLLN